MTACQFFKIWQFFFTLFAPKIQISVRFKVKAYHQIKKKKFTYTSPFNMTQIPVLALLISQYAPMTSIHLSIILKHLAKQKNNNNDIWSECFLASMEGVDL